MQTLAVDVIVAAAAAWLVWSFAPSGLRRWFRLSRKKRDQGVAPEPIQDCACVDAGVACEAPGAPLRAEELGG